MSGYIPRSDRPFGSILPQPINNIIILYLTPLPELPFSDELLETMKIVSKDLERCTYYRNYYYTDTLIKHNVMCALIQSSERHRPYIGNHRYIRYPAFSGPATGSGYPASDKRFLN